MASIASEPSGKRRIQFVADDGSRPTIRLGKMSMRQAEAVKLRIEDLAAAKLARHTPSDETTRWLLQLDDKLHKRIAAVGLCKQRGSALLGPFTREYIDGRSDIQPRTRDNLERARGYLLEVFHETKPMREFTRGDADNFRQRMIHSGRSENTTRRAIGRARQFFTAAIRHGLLMSNPFEGIAASVGASEERFHFVSQEDAVKVLAACPDAQWRVIFALCRFGGLRCPSEVLAVTWSDVDWEQGRVRVPSPKTARQGKASRTIPLFPELRQPLMDAFEQAEDGAVHIVARFRDSGANLRTHMQRIIRKAGLEPWPKTFQNLRSSRETELAAEHPIHVVCSWLGNTTSIATKHYLRVTDDDYRRAVGSAAIKKVAQNAAQNVHASKRTLVNDSREGQQKTPAIAGANARSRGYAQPCKNEIVPRRGLEPLLPP